MAQKLNAQGGTGTGTTWDDGSDHEGVTKIEVGQSPALDYIKFDYLKGGQPKEGALHGSKGRRTTMKPFVINHPDEYLISVEAWHYDNEIQGIQFKTNEKTSEIFGYPPEPTDTRFTLQVQDKKIIGFHGSADNKLNSIGAYFAPTTTTVPAKKLEAKGGDTGVEWDDAAHDNVTKVYVGQGGDGVAAVKFEYANGSQVVIGEERGKPTRLGYEDPFELEADEYITIVEGTWDNIYGVGTVVTMLKFTTNKNRTSIPYGMETPTGFDFKEEGHKITGFHGRFDGNYINAIGVYVAPVGTIPLTPAVPAKKLDSKGGEAGVEWDDATHENVTKVYVGQGQDGVAALKFEYTNGSQVVIGEERGKPTRLGFEDPFVLESDEYITIVEGTYDNIFGAGTIITMVKFTTNKNRTSIPYGMETPTGFDFKEEGHKITGFHGRFDGNYINAIGVYLAPVGTIPLTPAQPA